MAAPVKLVGRFESGPVHIWTWYGGIALRSVCEALTAAVAHVDPRPREEVNCRVCLMDKRPARSRAGGAQ
jgi:hypothetical protein